MGQKGQKNQTNSLPKGLFEALRDLPEGILNDAKDQMGFYSQKDPQKQQEEEYRAKQQEERLRELFSLHTNRAQEVKREEQIVFSAKEQETKAKVESLAAEVRKMASAVKELEDQVYVAASVSPANPGVYHETFFEKLISFVKSMTKNIKNSSVWLGTSNSRAKKNPYYWQQVKKSGTKFMLSEERYMSTQAG